MKDALLRGRHDDFGQLLDEAWQSKRRLSPKIATPFIDEVYDVAMASGAIGGKVTGAGGGGYMVFYCHFDRRHLVAEELIKRGLSVSEITFDLRPDHLAARWVKASRSSWQHGLAEYVEVAQALSAPLLQTAVADVADLFVDTYRPAVVRHSSRATGAALRRRVMPRPSSSAGVRVTVSRCPR